MDPKTINDIRWRAAWLRAQLNGLPSLSNPIHTSGSDWTAMRTRRMQALDRLVDALAVMPGNPTVKVDGAGARVRMFGISCTSTMGIEGALRNWLTRAGQLQAD